MFQQGHGDDDEERQDEDGVEDPEEAVRAGRRAWTILDVLHRDKVPKLRAPQVEVSAQHYGSSF